MTVCVTNSFVVQQSISRIVKVVTPKVPLNRIPKFDTFHHCQEFIGLPLEYCPSQAKFYYDWSPYKYVGGKHHLRDQTRFRENFKYSDPLLIQDYTEPWRFWSNLSWVGIFGQAHQTDVSRIFRIRRRNSLNFGVGTGNQPQNYQIYARIRFWSTNGIFTQNIFFCFMNRTFKHLD